VVFFVFAGELGMFEWLLSFCLFSLFSHISCCFTLEEEIRYTQKCSPGKGGHLHMIGFPFAKMATPKYGVVTVDCFFFDKSIYYQKRRGAQPLVHREYTRGIRERERKKRENLQS
jgi:hypothetical protein